MSPFFPFIGCTLKGAKQEMSRTWCALLQMEEMMDLVQSGAVKALELRDKQEELRRTDQAYIQVGLCLHSCCRARVFLAG